MDDVSSELVVKSNELIEASYRLTLLEQQLILFAICSARDQQLGLSSDTELAVDVRAFAQQFKLNIDTAYQQVKDTALSLYKRELHLGAIDPADGEYRVALGRWVTLCAYKKKRGYVAIRFSEEVIPCITRLEERFTSYRLEHVSQLTSVHAIRIYELLVQHVRIGARMFELGELKKILGVAGEYADVSDFKRRVLDVSVAQINAHTDLKISYTQEKDGRTVSAIVFSIRLKTAELAAPKKPKRPVQLGLNGVEPARKSNDPGVLAEREKLLAMAGVKRKKYDPDFDPATEPTDSH